MGLTLRSKILESWVKLDTLETDAEFLLKPLDTIGQMEYEDAIMVAVNKDHGALSTLVCQVVIDKGLMGWKGIFDDNGKEVEFDKSKHFSDKMSGFPSIAIKMIAHEIIERSKFTEDDKKK